MTRETAELEWKPDGVPVSTIFDDPYYSLEDGLSETRHVFLAGNNLPDRFRPGFHVAELGFGTGLNLIATLLAWRESGVSGKLHYTGFEAYPMSAEEIDTALSNFPEIRAAADPLIKAWARGDTHIVTEDLDARIIVGDARETIGHWQGFADAWFLDGFAPARNPELWEPTLMTEVALHTAPSGTCATYTAAGFVRRALETAGFQVRRVPGFGRKRHMSLGQLV